MIATMTITVGIDRHLRKTKKGIVNGTEKKVDTEIDAAKNILTIAMV